MMLDSVIRVVGVTTAAITSGLAWYNQHGRRRRLRSELAEDLNLRDRLPEESRARRLLEEDIERRIEARLVLTQDQSNKKTRWWLGIWMSFAWLGTALAMVYRGSRFGLEAGWLALAWLIWVWGVIMFWFAWPPRIRDTWGMPLD